MYGLQVFSIFLKAEKNGKKPAQIWALHMKRLSERQITKRLQCSKSSVHRSIEKFKKREIYDDTKKN